LVAIGLGACAPSASSVESQPGPRSAPTALGPGDVFEVRVFGEPDLTGVHRVSSDGTISFPLVGRVVVANRSATEVSDELAAGLAKYVREPQVSIFVKEFVSKKIYVLGQVNQPGTFPFEDSMTIIQAVTLAGGFSKLAAQNDTLVTRIVDGQELRMHVPVKSIGEGRAPNFELEPGDIVYVPETIF
jgi:polysaccharide export outer membrane protein